MTVPQAPEDTLRAARETIDRLSRENTDLRHVNARSSLRISTLNQDNTRLVNDNELKARQLHTARTKIERIRQGIIDEAQERDWCDEVNDFLRSVGLDPWEKTFKVTFPETTVTITMSCAEQESEETIISQAWDMITDDRDQHMGQPTLRES